MAPAQRARVDEFFRAQQDPDDASVAEIVQVVVDAGGIDHARQCGERFAAEAELALADLPDSPARTALLESVCYVMDRRA